MGRRIRTVDIAKGNSYFAHVPYIESTLKDLLEKLSKGQHLRSLNQGRFAGHVADILGTLNAVHAFREGNGKNPSENSSGSSHTRTVIGLTGVRFRREELYQASDASFMRGDSTLFEKLLKGAIEPTKADRFPPPDSRST